MGKSLVYCFFWDTVYFYACTDCVDWVVVLCPTQHKTGHFRDVFPSQSFGLVWKKLNLKQQKHAFTNQHKCTTTQNKHKKTKVRYSCLLRHPAGNGEGLFSKEKISKGEEKVEKNEKRISREAYDINKQTYIMPKSKIKSRARYTPEPRVLCMQKTITISRSFSWTFCYWAVTKDDGRTSNRM